MLGREREKQLLQAAVALAALVPLTAGAAGVAEGPRMVGGYERGPADLESHFRYLSGLLLGLGIAFAATIPAIERRSTIFTSLSAIVVVGGLARVSALVTFGTSGSAHLLALVMELLVVPLLCTWQRRVARQFDP